jgi:hypothetical protein
MTQAVSIPDQPLVALFNASDDTVEMVSTHARRSGFNCVVGCHFSDLKSSLVLLVRVDPHGVRQRCRVRRLVHEAFRLRCIRGGEDVLACSCAPAAKP